MASRSVIIGSRGSKLALWQADFLQSNLKAIGISSEIKIIKTQGDIVQHLSFDKLEGKGFFTKEIENALLKKEVDVAVHSHKDLPTEETPGLVIAGVSGREDPAELLLVRKEVLDLTQVLGLPLNARVGTSAARRKCQLLHFRKDLHLLDLRGNVTTRIDKLREGQYEAILLAAAGINRLGLDLSDLHVERIEPSHFIPSAAQGILAYQVRADDVEMSEAIKKISDPKAKEIVDAERKVMSLLGGGCMHPIGVNIKQKADKYQMWVMRAEEWNDTCKRYYFVESSAEKLIDKVKKGLNVSSKNIFITREAGEESYFHEYLEQLGHTVTAQSLVEFKRVPFELPASFDWVFFSSRNAVKFFFNDPNVKDYLADHTVKFAAIGKGTAEEIKSLGYQVSFIGDSNEVVETGKAFAHLTIDGSILFPQAIKSLRTIQQQLPTSTKVIDLVVYDNMPTDGKVQNAEEFDVLVFTSPLNVETYLKKNKILPNQHVVAIGNATASALTEAGVGNHIIAYEPSEIGLADTVMGVIAGS